MTHECKHHHGHEGCHNKHSHEAHTPHKGCCAQEAEKSQEGVNEPSEDIQAKLQEELKNQKDLAAEYLQQMQRLQAEFDNFRKREEKQRMSLKELTIQNVMKDFLPVMDNFERALAAMETPNLTLEAFSEGVKLVFQQMEGFLTRLSVGRIEALGKPFNPNRHDAVAKNFSEQYGEDLIMQVLQNGWLMNDTVIRPAMVVVSGGKAPEGGA